MKTLKSVTLIFFLLLISNQSTFSQTKIDNLLSGITMSGDWFIANSNTKNGTNDWENAFILKRSYFTLKKKINAIFSVRYTQDITLDQEGDDRGNVETRMKYLYLKIKPQWTGAITGSYFEIGMVHRPWITYEQKINTYRVQGNMAVERNRLYNSAGFGVFFGGNIGAKMDKEYLKTVDGSMKGKWASFGLGLYNGGGYSQFEENMNKVVEGMINIRPFANTIPQIQLTHAFNIGEGNTAEKPVFQQLLFHGGYMGRSINISAQYHFGEGDFRGKMVDASNNSKALKNNGYSFFGEYKFEKTPLSLFARYDSFYIKNDEKTKKQREIGGIQYTMYKGIHLLLTGENDITKTNNEKEKDIIVDLSLQISF